MPRLSMGHVAGAALAITLVAGCADGGQRATPIGEEGEASEAVEAGAFTDGDVVSFESPTGNILCWFGPRLAGSHGPEGRNSPSVACQIKDSEEPAPPRPGHCGENIAWYLSAVLIDGEAMKGTCSNGAIAPTGPSAALDYGQHITEQGVRCASMTTGVTCNDLGSGAGFHIAREGIDLF
ncbi:DUF6636 domain-containing protein [Lolliginicoccus levis]|uniref:DUF6636 domain-containing protein n=1 Tax=Lolliginicoccus levis TaxID=2919542 RepID=UPI00241D46DB|nr:DUF6636 domain-containing protein [Lolliginicoccus levis]